MPQLPLSFYFLSHWFILSKNCLRSYWLYNIIEFHLLEKTSLFCQLWWFSFHLSVNPIRCKSNATIWLRSTSSNYTSALFSYMDIFCLLHDYQSLPSSLIESTRIETNSYVSHSNSCYPLTFPSEPYEAINSYWKKIEHKRYFIRTFSCKILSMKMSRIHPWQRNCVSLIQNSRWDCSFVTLVPVGTIHFRLVVSIVLGFHHFSS